MPTVRTVKATRYVTPLREGGSLPAIVEADDDGLYVLKFRGAGQGPKALIAELLVGEIGRALGLPVPELVFVTVDPLLGAAEPDPEIKDLVVGSAGLNLGLDFLPGALAFDPLGAAGADIDPLLASSVVWFDAYVMNVDRTPRNPNLLLWHRRLWLIDHGAALYVHHSWTDPMARSRDRFARIKDHVLLPYATALAEVDAALSARLTPETLGEIVALIPDDWLGDEPAFPDRAAQRAAYVEFLAGRLEAPRRFVEEAVDARAQPV